MRASWCWALALVATLSPQAIGQDRPRFSPEAVTLLEQISQAYDLNGRRMPAGQVDDAVLARLAKSNDPQIREVARMMPELKLLHALNRQQGREVVAAFGEQVRRLPASMAVRVIEALASPDEEKDDLRSAAKTLEAFLGSEPQKAVNKAWAIACLGNGLGIYLKGHLRELAARGGPADAAHAKAIAVTLGTGSGRLGTVTVTNQSGRTLHHCLLITRLEADRERLRALAAQEDAFGKFLLPSLGLSKETVAGSRLAAHLRYMFNEQDKGVVVYVPEIPAGGTVTTTLAAPGYYRVAKGADVSVWCDEGAVEHRPASNWDEARQAVAAAGRRPRPRSSGPGSRSADLFAVGSVWRGTSRVGPTGQPPTTQQIELTITERDGDSFKGKIKYNGRQTNTVAGTTADGSVKWEIVIRGKTGLPHAGEVKGRRMVVKYSGPSNGDTAIEGTMTLIYVSGGRR